MKKFYVDCETTGTDPKKHGIIQISAKIAIDGVIKDSLNLLVQPFPTDEINDDALKANGITKEQLFTYDRLEPAGAHKQLCIFLAKWVNKFEKTDKFFWVGYKAAFDSDMLREFFAKNGDTYFGSWFFTPPLCVMSLAGFLLAKRRHAMENFKLKTVYETLYPDSRYSEEDWHDAMFDIDRTIDVETALRQIIVGSRRRELSN